MAFKTTTLGLSGQSDSKILWSSISLQGINWYLCLTIVSFFLFIYILAFFIKYSGGPFFHDLFESWRKDMKTCGPTFSSFHNIYEDLKAHLLDVFEFFLIMHAVNYESLRKFINDARGLGQLHLWLYLIFFSMTLTESGLLILWMSEILMRTFFWRYW